MSRERVYLCKFDFRFVFLLDIVSYGLVGKIMIIKYRKSLYKTFFRYYFLRTKKTSESNERSRRTAKTARERVNVYFKFITLIKRVISHFDVCKFFLSVAWNVLNFRRIEFNFVRVVFMVLFWLLRWNVPERYSGNHISHRCKAILYYSSNIKNTSIVLCKVSKNHIALINVKFIVE